MQSLTAMLGKLILVAAALVFLATACASDATPAAGTDSVAGVVVKPAIEQDETEPSAEDVARESELNPLPVIDFVWFDGTPGSTADLIGTPTIINFWASSCPPCVAEMPAFEAAHQALLGSVDFVGIDVADDPTAARELAEQTGVTYRLADDPDSAVFRSFGGFVLPTTVLLNEQGEVAYIWAGALTGEELRILVDRHILPGSLEA